MTLITEVGRYWASVTPSVYTMRDEVDLFTDLMLQAAKKGITS